MQCILYVGAHGVVSFVTLWPCVVRVLYAVRVHAEPCQDRLNALGRYLTRVSLEQRCELDCTGSIHVQVDVWKLPDMSYHHLPRDDYVSLGVWKRALRYVVQ